MSAAGFGKVAVVFGGNSAERDVSLMSGKAVLAALQGAGVDAHPFDPAERALSELKTDAFDRVFLILHGRGGERLGHRITQYRLKSRLIQADWPRRCG